LERTVAEFNSQSDRTRLVAVHAAPDPDATIGKSAQIAKSRILALGDAEKQKWTKSADEPSGAILSEKGHEHPKT